MWHRKVQGMMPSQKLNEIRIQEELERRILHGLASEWEEALWVLDSPHEELMRKPLYRTVYTVKFQGAVYALHAFQKKARKGITISPRQKQTLT